MHLDYGYNTPANKTLQNQHLYALDAPSKTDVSFHQKKLHPPFGWDTQRQVGQQTMAAHPSLVRPHARGTCLSRRVKSTTMLLQARFAPSTKQAEARTTPPRVLRRSAPPSEELENKIYCSGPHVNTIVQTPQLPRLQNASL